MAKFNYHDVYDAFRYAITPSMSINKDVNSVQTYRNTYLGYFDSEMGFSCKSQCDASEFEKAFKGPSKNELYRRNKALVKRVIFNEPYTIVLWANGEKTIVKTQDGEPYDKEKGLAMCFAKYFLGNTGKYFDFFKEVCDEMEEKESEPTVLQKIKAREKEICKHHKK